MEWIWKLYWNIFFEKTLEIFSSETVLVLFIGLFLFRGILWNVFTFLIALTCLRNPNIKYFSVDKIGSIKYERFSDHQIGNQSHQVNKKKISFSTTRIADNKNLSQHR